MFTSFHQHNNLSPSLVSGESAYYSTCIVWTSLNLSLSRHGPQIKWRSWTNWWEHKKWNTTNVPATWCTCTYKSQFVHVCMPSDLHIITHITVPNTLIKVTLCIMVYPSCLAFWPLPFILQGWHVFSCSTTTRRAMLVGKNHGLCRCQHGRDIMEYKFTSWHYLKCSWIDKFAVIFLFGNLGSGNIPSKAN